MAGDFHLRARQAVSHYLKSLHYAKWPLAVSSYLSYRHEIGINFLILPIKHLFINHLLAPVGKFDIFAFPDGHRYSPSNLADYLEMYQWNTELIVPIISIK